MNRLGHRGVSDGGNSGNEGRERPHCGSAVNALAVLVYGDVVRVGDVLEAVARLAGEAPANSFTAGAVS